jgi:Ca-activated chloride channel family protein
MQAFIKGGNNRVILATDGDFNVGVSSGAALVQLIEKEREAGIFLSVLGFGMGNYKDNKMQQLADKGNGNHSYIDNINEAKKVMVSEFGSTLFTIAKDVKIQIEFNPARVQAYRLIGYENRLLQAEDFNDDKKDAGELGSGHTVTALYEVIPVGVKDVFTRQVDSLKYQWNNKTPKGPITNELLTIKLRYKKPDENTSMLLQQAVADKHLDLEQTSDNFRFSAAVAEFGMLLRDSKFIQKGSFQQVLSLAKSAAGKDANGYRAEFTRLVSAGEAATKNIVRKAPSQ